MDSENLCWGHLADESQFIHNYGSAQVVQSNLTSADVGSFSRADFDEFNWPVLYARIRQINLFLENIEDVPFDDADMEEQVKRRSTFSQCLFLS